MKLKLLKNSIFKNRHAELVSASQAKGTLKQVQGDNKRAFTLAEVLITLTIIGVIAAITIPNLAIKWEDMQTISAVKEAYSILNNAFKKLMYDEGGYLSEINWPYPTSANIANNNFFLEKLQSYIKFQKVCFSDKGCAPDVSYKERYKAYKPLNQHATTSGESWTEDDKFGKAIMQNGMMISIKILHPQGARANFGEYDSLIGSIRADVNGAQGPNRNGYDVFWFYFNRKGLVPYNYPDYCNSFTGKEPAYACATWVIKHGNLDYKYRDVSAEW